MRIGAWDFVPYVLASPVVGGEVDASRVLPGTRILDVLADESAPFFRRLSAANAIAFPEMPMPPWVQLDCATLPGAMVGFALRRDHLPAELAERFGPALGEGGEVLSSGDLHPISAFCAVPTVEPARVVAFTLFSLLPGLELGLRTKAMGLLLLGARKQVGVTRRTGPVRALHERLGRLRVLKDRPLVHPAAEDSMVYELDVPAPAILRDLVLKGSRRRQTDVESAS